MKKPGDIIDHFGALDGSINRYYHGKKVLRWSHQAQGLVLYSPRTGMVFVPFQLNSGGGWAVVVVVEDFTNTYRRGGYHLDVGEDEIITALEVQLELPVSAEEQHV